MAKEKYHAKVVRMVYQWCEVTVSVDEEDGDPDELIEARVAEGELKWKLIEGSETEPEVLDSEEGPADGEPPDPDEIEGMLSPERPSRPSSRFSPPLNPAAAAARASTLTASVVSSLMFPMTVIVACECGQKNRLRTPLTDGAAKCGKCKADLADALVVE